MNPHIQLLLPKDSAKEEPKKAKFTINPNNDAQTRYDALHGAPIILSESSLAIKPDHLELSIGSILTINPEVDMSDIHMTLAFKRGIGNSKNQDLIGRLWRETLEELRR